MPKFSVVKGDITDQTTDVIVNASNTSLLAGGDQGVNGAVHKKVVKKFTRPASWLGFNWVKYLLVKPSLLQLGTCLQVS